MLRNLLHVDTPHHPNGLVCPINTALCCWIYFKCLFKQMQHLALHHGLAQMHSTIWPRLHIDFSTLGHTSIFHQMPFRVEDRSKCIKVSSELFSILRGKLKSGRWSIAQIRMTKTNRLKNSILNFVSISTLTPLLMTSTIVKHQTFLNVNSCYLLIFYVEKIILHLRIFGWFLTKGFKSL